MNHLKSVATRIAFALLFLVVTFASGASAQPVSKFQILLDLDNNQSTGCDVTALTGTVHGVERILTTTVDASLSPPQVTKIEVSVCTGTTFGAPTDITPAGTHPVGMGNGTGGASVIETFIPASQAPLGHPPIIRLAVLAFDNGGVLRDEMLTTRQGPGNGPPILMQAALSIIEIPTLSEMGLLLLGLLLALAAVALLRRRSATALMVALLLLGLAGAAWAAAFDLDGNTLAEWTPDTLLATEPTPDAPAGTDIQALFGARDAAGLHFRIDANLLFNQPPVANDDSATVTQDSSANPINVLANDSDPEGDPFTVGSVTQAAHGTVAITGGGTGVSYTPNAGYCNNPPGTTLDTFTYTLAPGGNTATVTVTVNCVSTAVDDAYNAVTNTALNVPAGTGVTSNDTVNGGSIASYGAATGGEQTTIGAATPTSAGGSVSLNPNGSFIYNPPTNFTGTDTFKYVLQNAGGTSTATVTFTVSKATQTINFTSTAPANAKVGGPTYTVTATATPSGLPVTFTIDATATSVCSISGSTVSFIGAGTCVIDADQPGDVNYAPAPQVQQSFAVGKGDQTITFTSTAPANAKAGGPTYTVTATGGASGQPVTFTIDATATSVCSISGSTVSFLAVGTCVIDADQAGDANYNAATQAQQSVPVGKGDQTITFTSTAPATAKVGGPTYTVTATGGASGQPVTFTIDATATSVCSISGSTVSFLAVGTCVIDANQAGNANYNAATQVQQSVPVGKGDQAITFTSTAPATAKVGGPTYTVTATGGASGQPVIFTIDATATSVCSISGSTVSFIGAGTCVIDANQAGNANYNAATQVQQSGAVSKGDQTITFTSTAPAGATVGGPTYTVTATASSGLPVTFTIDATATSVCSISGSTVSFIGAGTCVIDANQAGNASYNAAPQVQQSFPVAKGNQTISFTSTAPVGAAVGGPTYTVTATATSGLPVTFTIDAASASVCSISGSTVSFIGAGTCVIDANQPGNANYNAAPQVQQSFPVAKANQTISFTSTAPINAKVSGPTYTVTATATSGLAVTFTIDASATSVCSISGSTVSFIGGGTCVIDANQAGNANYNAAPQVQQSFLVAKNDQTITFTSTPPVSASVGGPTYTVTATASSGLTVTFTIDASATSVCSISGSTVSFIGGGTCVIDANQAGNFAYNPAPQVQQSFHVNQPPMLTTNPISYTTPGNTQLHVGATLPGVAAWTDAQNITAKAQPTDSDGPGTLSIVAASGTTANGGSYSIDTNGNFTYVPAAGFTGADSFTYQVTDTQDTTTGTVNVTVGQRVWYIRDIVDGNNAAGGDGRSTNAFDSIAAFNAATTNNGDIIFIFRGNTGTTPLSGNLTLKDGQKLWGQGIALDLTSSGFGVLVAAGSKPVISSTGDAVSVPATAGNRQNVEVRGLDITATGNGVKVNATGANNVSVTISDDNLTSTSAASLNGVNLSAGSTGTFAATLNNDAIATTGATANGNAFDARTTAATTMTISFSNNAVVSKATGILIDGSGGGTTTITGFANNAVDKANAGTGISITSAKFDAVPGGGYDTVSGGTTVLGITGDGMGGNGVVLSNVSGDLAFTDLDIFADGGAAFRLTGTGAVNTGAGTGTRVTVGAGVGIFEAVNGPAVDVTNATIDLQLSSLKSTSSATTGVSLDTVTGTFSAGNTSAITNATGTNFNVNAGTATISYDGTITNAAGRSVSVTSKGSGSTTFNGTITATGGTGIFLNGNTGSTISFTKKIALTTGANDAFTATGGGTVTSTDTTSTITTTTGTALNVANTTIGAGGLKFASVSAGTAASGPASGIVLNNTGASGGLTVNGGTIQKTTSHGVSLTSTLSPSFNAVTIKNTGGSGVNGTTVTNFTFTNGTVDTTGTGTDQSNIAFNTAVAGTENNISGTLTITGNSLLNSGWHGVDVQNFNGTLSNATISNNTITSPTTTAASKGSGIRLQGLGSTTTAASVTKATIANNIISNFPSGAGILAQGGNSNASGPAGTFGTPGNAASIISITGNQIKGQSVAVPLGTSAIIASVNGKGQANFDISTNGTVANPLTNMAGTAILCGGNGNTTSTFNVNGNVIVANNTVASNGVGGGTGVTFGTSDTPDMTFTITSNNISATDGNGILAVARGATGNLKAKIQNNTVAAPLTGVREGIRIDAGNASSVNDSVCLNISGNTSAGSGGVQGIGLRKQGTVTTTNAFGVNGMAATSSPGVETYVNGLNPAGNGTLLLSATSGFSNCSLP